MSKKLLDYYEWQSKGSMRNTPTYANPHRHKLTESIKEFLKYMKKTDNILDVGCRDGYSLQVFDGFGYNVVGIDVCVENLHVCKNAGLKAYWCDACDMRLFEDDSFDGMFIRHTFHQLHDASKALEEVVRVLKGGGKVLIIIPNSAELNPYELHKFTLDGFREFIAGEGLLLKEVLLEVREDEIWFLGEKHAID